MEESTDPEDVLRLRLYRSIILAVLEESLSLGTYDVSVEVLRTFAESLTRDHLKLFSAVWSVETTFMEIRMRGDRLVF